MVTSIVGTKDGIEKIRACIESEIINEYPQNAIIKSVDLSEIISECDICIVENQSYIEEDHLSSVERSKIVNWEYFRSTTRYNPIGAFNGARAYQGLILGMSHSQCGILDETSFENKFFKVSAPSMDLWCHSEYYKWLAENYPDRIRALNKIVIEVPFYIFNYDLSRFGTFVYSKLNYYKHINKWHHFGENDQQKRIREQFCCYWNVLKITEVMETSRFKNPLYKPFRTIYRMVLSATNHDSVWCDCYEQTITENKTIWDTLIKDISVYSPNASIFLLVMPFNPIFRLTHRRQIEYMMDIFFECVKGIDNANIIDDFKLYNNPLLFSDHCHLNVKGRQKYSKQLFSKL